ncbi:MAG: DUF502 domain-containing protein [Candidatus Tectomicrobia bacterium]|nr:DUF502 domain-containing protein [Candidatus Tectomicrobia bacterium]
MTKNFRAKVRRIFLAGLLVTLPATFTVWVFAFLFGRLDNLLAPYVKQGLTYLAMNGFPWAKGISIPGVGIIATFFIVFFIGLFTTSYFGRKIVTLGESIVHRIPYIRGTYLAAKQFLVAITMSDRTTIRQVVMIEYPRRGVWTLGFLTWEGGDEVQDKTEDYMVHVLLPTTPNPTSGWLVLVPKSEVVPLSMTVEEGIKLIISGGIVTPKGGLGNKAQFVSRAEESLARTVVAGTDSNAASGRERRGA